MKLPDHRAFVRAFLPLAKPGQRSARKLRAFLSDVRKAAKTSVTEWHVAEVSGMIAMALEEDGDPIAAANLFRRMARDSHGEMMYQARSTRDHLTFAAELYEAAGKRRDADKVRASIAEIDRFIESRLEALKVRRRGA